MILTLTVTQTGSEQVQSQQTFDQEAVTIGRAKNADLVLADSSKQVSNKHARIERRDGAWFVVDLSMNGTLHNGARLEKGKAAPLADGDELVVGSFHVRAGNAEQASPANGMPAAVGGRDELAAAQLRALLGLADRFVGTRSFASAADVQRFGELLLHVLESTFEWVATALGGRKKLHEKLGAEVTRLLGRELNPLKSGNSAEIARFVLDWRAQRNPATLRENLDQLYRDLTLHQIALVAGLQESLQALLQRLDPKVIEAQAQEQAGLIGTFVGKLAPGERAWRQYVHSFKEIYENSQRLFNEVVFPNLKSGYLGAHAKALPQPQHPPD